jgi:hypothetical protein
LERFFRGAHPLAGALETSRSCGSSQSSGRRFGENLVRLAIVTGDDNWRRKADVLFAGLLPTAAQSLYVNASLAMPLAATANLTKPPRCKSLAHA